MGKGVPFHFGFLHVVELRLGVAVRTDEDNLKVLLVGVTKLYQIGSEGTAGWAPVSGKVKTHGLSLQNFFVHFLALRIEKRSCNQVTEGRGSFGRMGLGAGYCKDCRECVKGSEGRFHNLFW